MGRIFLDFLKPRQFHFVYLIGGVLGAILFAIAFNVFPVFRNATDATVIGSSAAVMAIVVATATLVPNFSISLLLFGEVKLKYLALAYVVLDLIGSTSANAGGSLLTSVVPFLALSISKRCKVEQTGALYLRRDLN